MNEADASCGRQLLINCYFAGFVYCERYES